MIRSRVLRNDDGSVAVPFAISAVVLMAFCGAALDFMIWHKDQSEMQAAADAAVLAAAQELTKTSWSKGKAQDMAKQYLLDNVPDDSGVGLKSVTIDDTAGRVTLMAEKQGRRSLTSFVMAADPTIRVKATAEVSAGGSGMPLCVLALDPAMSKALEGSGGTAWTANQCVVHVNSSSTTAVNLSGGSSITSGKNCFVGGVQQGLSMVRPAPEPGCVAVADPFASIAKPSVSCDYPATTYNTPRLVPKGTYCGGLTLQNAAFTFEEGIYTIKDGPFVTTGGAQLTSHANGTTFFLTGNNAGVTWSGGGSYHLVASKTGPLAGFVIYLDPNANRQAKSHISGGGGTYYEGILYFPKQKLEVSGGGTVTTPSPFTAFVANNFLFSGGGQLNINVDKNATSVPIPTGLYKEKSPPRLVN